MKGQAGSLRFGSRCLGQQGHADRAIGADLHSQTSNPRWLARVLSQQFEGARAQHWGMSHSYRKLRTGSIDKAGCEVHHPMSDRRGVFTRRIRVTQPPADSVGGREKTLEERHGGRFLLPEFVDLDSQVFGARDEFHALSGNVDVGSADGEGYPRAPPLRRPQNGRRRRWPGRSGERVGSVR